jgi:hypothetical protein
VNAGRTDPHGEPWIIRNEETDAPLAADHGKISGDLFVPRLTIMAVNQTMA